MTANELRAAQKEITDEIYRWAAEWKLTEDELKKLIREHINRREFVQKGDLRKLMIQAYGLGKTNNFFQHTTLSVKVKNMLAISLT